jgi:hypothetical protein
MQCLLLVVQKPSHQSQQKTEIQMGKGKGQEKNDE